MPVSSETIPQRLKIGNNEVDKWDYKIFNLSDSATAFPGAAIVKRNNDVLIYTVLNGEKDKSKDILLSRLLLSRVNDKKFKLQYLTKNNQWRQGLDWKLAKRIFKKGSTELSIHFDRKLNKWVAIQSKNEFLSQKIIYREAEDPLGPWGNTKELFQYPEMKPGHSFDKDNFCYAGKGHAQFSSPGKLIFTYVCNSFDFKKQVNNLKIYKPIVVIKNM